MATSWKMKAVIVLVLVLLTAATVVAYGHAEAAEMAAAVLLPSQSDEAVSLLLSGSALIGLAGALRRLAI